MTKLQHTTTAELLRQLNEAHQAWTMYTRRAMRPGKNTIATLEKRILALRTELQARVQAIN